MRYESFPSMSEWKNDTRQLRGNTLLSNNPFIRNDSNAYNPITLDPIAKKLLEDEIDDMVGKYWTKLISSMTKRNILQSLSQTIGSLNASSPLATDQRVQDLKEVADRTLRAISPTTSKYSHVRCIAWKVQSGSWENGSGVYFSTAPNDLTDMKTKCTYMKQAIKAARDSLGNKDDKDDTLKVFMAPEFYFRGKNGAYSPDIVADIIPILQEDTKHRNFKDWLFVFGTAVSAFETTEWYCPACDARTVEFRPGQNDTTKPTCKTNAHHAVKEEVVGAEIHNVALVQKGDDTYTVAKEFTSDIDYNRKEVTLHPDPKDYERLVKDPKDVPVRKSEVMKTLYPEGSRFSAIKSRFDDERMGGCIFTVDGITFGMEICLDHAAGKAGRLRNYSYLIDLLLIPSWGMEITNPNVKDGGIIFNVDGQVGGGAKVVTLDQGRAWTQLATPDTPKGIEGSLDFFGPFPLP